ncbi:hypothetical protein WNY81_11975 [Shewanella frigidimarina]|uniref:hypothetical protein n=1 Tax=Shewanella frigidimarina TaxID=56812 RepID=UPI0031739423
MIVKGTVTSGNVYADGTRSMEIMFSLNDIDNLPYIQNDASIVKLTIGEVTYLINLRHTDNNSYLWFSPFCHVFEVTGKAQKGQRMRLSDVLIPVGFQVNDSVDISFEGTTAKLMSKI